MMPPDIMEAGKMNQQEVEARVMLRLPQSLRDRAAIEAKRNRRSVNSELVVALEKAFPETASGGVTS